GRFRVEGVWKDFSGNVGLAKATPRTDDTASFWFFTSSNVELMLKVLDGRPVNGNYWVFYGALSNVEYTVRVTDTRTGSVRRYANPSGAFASVADTSAFAGAGSVVSASSTDESGPAAKKPDVDASAAVFRDVAWEAVPGEGSGHGSETPPIRRSTEFEALAC